MPTFQAVRRHDSSASTFTSCGTFSFQGPSPITPNRAKCALQLRIQLSSPIENYEITAQDDSPSKSPNTKIFIKHPHSDRLRVGAKANAISKIERKMDDLTKLVERERGERENERIERERERIERENERIERENERIERENERIERENERIERETSWENERIERETSRQNERIERENERIERETSRQNERIERETSHGLIVAWETCDRIAQAINDFVKEEVKKSALYDVIRIWDNATFGNRNRYLPHLFTTWFLVWNNRNPEMYPLPDYLSPLKTDRLAYQHAPNELTKDFDLAATTLWSTMYQPLLSLMLQVYWLRPQERNQRQYPAPTAGSALSYLQRFALPEQTLSAIPLIIKHGMKMEQGRWSFLFDDGDSDRPEQIGQDEFHNVLRRWLENAKSKQPSEVQYAKGEKKRDSENQDDLEDDRACKRVKHDTFPSSR